MFLNKTQGIVGCNPIPTWAPYDIYDPVWEIPINRSIYSGHGHGVIIPKNP